MRLTQQGSPAVDLRFEGTGVHQFKRDKENRGSFLFALQLVAVKFTV